MGEAKRKKAKEPVVRTWATGKLRIEANDVHCFDWIGTKQEAVELEMRYLGIVNALGLSAEFYAKRAAGYLMAFGMPKVGDPDRRPSNIGHPWAAEDIELYYLAVLWTALHEHIPNTGQRLEDVFVGKELMVVFIGDPKEIIEDTVRELNGQPFSGGEYTMTVAVLRDHKLNPDDAITIRMADICTLAGRPAPEELANDPIYVPRFPRDAAEADAMMQTWTILTDITDPSKGIREYAGYTNDEMMQGKKPSL